MWTLWLICSTNISGQLSLLLGWASNHLCGKELLVSGMAVISFDIEETVVIANVGLGTSWFLWSGSSIQSVCFDQPCAKKQSSSWRKITWGWPYNANLKDIILHKMNLGILSCFLYIVNKCPDYFFQPFWNIQKQQTLHIINLVVNHNLHPVLLWFCRMTVTMETGKVVLSI